MTITFSIFTSSFTSQTSVISSFTFSKSHSTSFSFLAINFLSSTNSASSFSYFTIRNFYNRFHKSSISLQCLTNHDMKFIFNTSCFTMLNLYHRFYNRFAYFFVFKAFKSTRDRSLKKSHIFELFISSLLISSLFIFSLFIFSLFIFSLTSKLSTQARIISYFQLLVKISIKLISMKKYVNS